MKSVGEQRDALIAMRDQIQNYLETLKRQVLISEFNEALWYGSVDQMRVTQDENL